MTAPTYAPGQIVLEFTVPLLSVSEANVSRAASLKAQVIKTERISKQRSDVNLIFRSVLARAQHAHLRAGHWPLPLHITLTRIAPPRRKIHDDDNLRSSMKAVRDAVAAVIGADDRMSGPLRFKYRQEPGEWSARICIRAWMPPLTDEDFGYLIGMLDFDKARPVGLHEKLLLLRLEGAFD